MAPLAEALAAAAARVARVAAGRSLSVELQAAGEGAAAGSRPALIDLCHGTLRRYGRSQAIVAALSRRGTQAEPQVEALLWCALYALDSGRYAEYTVVDQAARACELLRRARAKPFVNALLRAYLRARQTLQASLERDEVARFQHPSWWIEKVRADHPEAWREILAQGNSHPPMSLRVNLRRTTVADYAVRLSGEGIGSRPIGEAGLLLARPVSVERLPGFREGEVSVQDAGAQKAASLLGLRDGLRVLDACAAPGGKCAHLLERADVSLTALDADPARCADIEANLSRLGLSARVKAADATDPGRWWDGAPFDRILADVPCSASGVARRHPDIKWLRRAVDVAAFADRQSRLLDGLWRTLAPNGKLLYVTCSVFREENGGVIDAFTARTPQARLARAGNALPLQLQPAADNDGFYFALLEKPA